MDWNLFSGGFLFWCSKTKNVFPKPDIFHQTWWKMISFIEKFQQNRHSYLPVPCYCLQAIFHCHWFSLFNQLLNTLQQWVALVNAPVKCYDTSAQGCPTHSLRAACSPQGVKLQVVASYPGAIPPNTQVVSELWVGSMEGWGGLCNVLQCTWGTPMQHGTMQQGEAGGVLVAQHSKGGVPAVQWEVHGPHWCSLQQLSS